MLKLKKRERPEVNYTPILLTFEQADLVDQFLHHVERSNRVDGVKIACNLDKNLRKYANEVSMEIHEPKVNKRVKEWFNMADDSVKPTKSKLPL